MVIWQWLSWYLALWVVALAAMPLTLRLFSGMPVGGLLFARSLGILLTGYVLWIGFALGILGNNAGGAWIAVAIVFGVGMMLGRGNVATLRRSWRSRDWRTFVIGEAIFLLAFAVWAMVRAHDAGARHTEQPMDLMFMNSIWASPNFPPQDGWLSGYPISYYYFGYWLLVTMGRLAGTMPEVTYNLGQSAWYGLLLSGAFGLTVTLLLSRFSEQGEDGDNQRGLGKVAVWLGGVFGAVAVGVTSNIQGILEWLHAQGVNVDALARIAQVQGFPENAPVTHQWYIGLGDWFWWRSSRVLADFSLRGDHQEVIAEYPAFSYVLGDNHPHVLAMPFAILTIALIAVWYFVGRQPDVEGGGEISGWRAILPHDWPLFAVTAIALGALLATNTWDFPPYLLLFGLAVFSTVRQRRVVRTFVISGLVAIAAVALYLPYFLTAQSQADGLNVNFFNPTHLGQFLWVWLAMLLGVVTLMLVAWRGATPKPRTLVTLLLVTVGAPLLFLAATWLVTSNTPALYASLQQWMPLPDGVSDYVPLILERWQSGIWTLLLVALFLAVAGSLWLRRLDNNGDRQVPQASVFLLIMAGVGLFLIYVPEFVFLDDNFGWRMNTIFKFYYQAWLLLGIVTACGVTLALARLREHPAAAIVAIPAVALICAGVVFVAAAAWSRSGGTTTAATFDASAWVNDVSPAQREAAMWLREHAPADAIIAEAVGNSYASDKNIVSTLSGRPTLIGWEGHERQWRGNAAFGEMSEGRAKALETIYRTGGRADVLAAMDRFGIDYVVVGPSERSAYSLSPLEIARLDEYLGKVFEARDVAIYARE